MQWLFGSVADWDALFANAYRVCRPGGWVESAEPSVICRSDHVEIPKSSALRQWTDIFLEGAKKSGQSFTVVEDDLQVKGMQAAGFVDIHVTHWKVSFCESRARTSLGVVISILTTSGLTETARNLAKGPGAQGGGDRQPGGDGGGHRRVYSRPGQPTRVVEGRGCCLHRDAPPGGPFEQVFPVLSAEDCVGA